MSTTPVWTVHCDSTRGAEFVTAANGMTRVVDGCHGWVGEEHTLAEAHGVARSAGWSIVGKAEAYCPACRRSHQP